MKRSILLTVLLASLFCSVAGSGQQSRFRALAFYSTNTEPDHVQFAEGALKFFREIAAKDNFTFDATTNWDDLNNANLSKYQVVLWLNDFPNKAEQRLAFQNYMEAGGAWLGFHVSAYNDADTHWPWLVDFLGGGLFDMNSWPPLPAKLVIDDRSHPVTKNLPENYLSPANEWYIWKPSPRLNPNVRVLVTLDPSNYPLGLKDVLTGGDLPVVWTNAKYKMIYMNTGHGDKIFTSHTQNKMFEDALVWLGTKADRASPAAGTGFRVSPQAVVVNPKTGKAYAVNRESNIVTVVDGARQTVTTVKAGSEPVAIAVNEANNKIYIANSASGTVTIIDGTSDTVTATVQVGELPYVVAVNPANNKIYVSRTFSNTMTVIAGDSNKTSTLNPGVQADAIAVNAVTNKIYLLGYEGNDVTVIDGANDSVTKVAAGTHLWEVAVNSTNNKIYLTNSGNSSVAVLDGTTNSVTSVGTGNIPCAVAVDSGTNRIYVANYTSDSVTVIDGSNNTVIATVHVGSQPHALAIDSKTHRVYVANTHSNNVTVIDGAKNSVIATVNAGNSPYAIAVDSVNNKAYAKTLAGDTLAVIDGVTLTATSVSTITKQ